MAPRRWPADMIVRHMASHTSMKLSGPEASAHGPLGVTLDSVGRMRGQPPIKPVSVATVAERRP